MLRDGLYHRQRLVLKELGQRTLYPLLQHCEQAKHLRQRRKLLDKAGERYDAALVRHSLGKDELVCSELMYGRHCRSRDYWWRRGRRT